MAGKLVDNETAKLSANYINGVAIAVFVVGGFAPIVSLVTGTSEPQQTPAIGIMMVGCIMLSAALHSLARRLLEGLKE